MKLSQRQWRDCIFWSDQLKAMSEGKSRFQMALRLTKKQCQNLSFYLLNANPSIKKRRRNGRNTPQYDGDTRVVVDLDQQNILLLHPDHKPRRVKFLDMKGLDYESPLIRLRERP